ncbi:MAG: hypothetical protein LQ348_003144 [Seirophora lacunosa]|nr:MAG: hypothetical protein LQ348_003144 [Seirophora lacunosa]
MAWPTRFLIPRRIIFVLQATFVCILSASIIFGLTSHATASSWPSGLGAKGSSRLFTKQGEEKNGKSQIHRARELADAEIKVNKTSLASKSSVAAAATGLKDANATLLHQAPMYIGAILDPDGSTFDILSCPALKRSRYQYLRDAKSAEVSPQAPRKWKYYFALDLTECAHVLPRLLGSILQAIRFLGPENCALSIVEGRSTDGTYEILLSLRKALEEAGITYHLTTSNINPQVGHRIVGLAALRNLALQPLFDNSKANGSATSDTTIVFINDVSLCPDDILELIHQRQKQKADMICAMDWVYLGPNPTFYDCWIARGMNGDTFFEIPPDGTWDRAWDLFWNNNEARTAVLTGRPFQVYSCWNGAVVFTAKPFLESGVRFRIEHPGECPQGEPKSMCKDFWLNGYGKIAVAPSVNIEYSDEGSKKIKTAKGYVSDWVDGGEEEAVIKWQAEPPEKVKCMPTYENQTWPAWDEPKGAKIGKMEGSVNPVAVDQPEDGTGFEGPRHYRAKGVWR